MKLFSALAALATALLTTGAAEAATCGITATTAVTFVANYNVFSGAAVTGQGSITYQCSLVGIGEVVYIELGTGLGNSYFPRKLTHENGVDTLNYNLYRDAAFTIIWGDTTPGTQRFGPTILNLFPRTLDVFARIPGGQNARAGKYSDTIVVSAIF